MKTPILSLTLAMLPLAALAADISGTWKSEFDSQIGHQKYTFTFKQEGTKLTGKANSEAEDRKREAELKEGKVDGDSVSFFETLNVQDNDIRQRGIEPQTTQPNSATMPLSIASANPQLNLPATLDYCEKHVEHMVETLGDIAC